MSGCAFIGSGFVGSSSSGGGGGGGPAVYALPEQWVQNAMGASQTNVALSAQLSTNFDTYKVLRAGSIVLLSTRLTSAVTGGSLTVEVTLNGAGTGLLLSHTSGSNASGGTTSVPLDTVAYVGGDLIGTRLTTSGAFATAVASDVEVMMQVAEEL